MKNAHAVNAKISQAIKAAFETVEDAWLNDNMNKLENRLISYVDRANADDQVVVEFVSQTLRVEFSEIIRFECEMWFCKGMISLLTESVETAVAA